MDSPWGEDLWTKFLFSQYQFHKSPFNIGGIDVNMSGDVHIVWEAFGGFYLSLWKETWGENPAETKIWPGLKKKNHFFLAKIMIISKIWKAFFKEKLAIIDVHTVRWWRLCLLPSWRPPPVLEGQWSLQTALLCWDSCTILEDWALGAISFRHCLWKV